MSNFRRFASKHGLDDTLYGVFTPKEANDVVRVAELPKCDLCGENEARYDAKMRGRSSWANMCEDCFQMYGEGLGTGKGQRLVVDLAQDHPVSEPEQSFEDWMGEVDGYVERLVGLSTSDLPDRDYRGDYEGGWTPKEVAKEVFRDLQSGDLF